MSLRSDIAVVSTSVTARTDSSASTMVDRYCGNTSGATVVDYVLPNAKRFAGPESLQLIDTDAWPAGHPIETGSSILHWHVLWVRDESTASVTITSTDGRQTWPIAPGDTVSVPPGYRMSTSVGQLALMIMEATTTGITVAPKPPSHGYEHFDGYNRCTTIPAPGSLSLFRWKLTQPLDIRQHHAGDLLLVSLAGEPAILTSSMVIAPRRGQAVVAPDGSEPRVLPNGLSYLLVIAPAPVSR